MGSWFDGISLDTISGCELYLVSWMSELVRDGSGGDSVAMSVRGSFLVL